MRIVTKSKERGEIFKKFKNETEKKVFKLEVLQYYSEGVENKPSLQRWLKGNKEESIRLLKQNAKEMAAWWPKNSRIKKIRIHMVEYPLSDYVQWEIEAYKNVNIPEAGEEVYLLDSKYMEEYPDIPEGWIFDDNRVISTIYDKDGRVKEFEVYEHDEAKSFLELRDKLLKLPLERIQQND